MGRVQPGICGASKQVRWRLGLFLAAALLGAPLSACTTGPVAPSVEVPPSPVPEAGSLAAALAQSQSLAEGQSFDLLVRFKESTKLGWFALIHGYSVVVEAQGVELASQPPALRVLPTHLQEFSLRADEPASDGLRFANHLTLRFPTGDRQAAQSIGLQVQAWGGIQDWAFVPGPTPPKAPDALH